MSATRRGGQVDVHPSMIRRLCRDFPEIPPDVVEQRVSDVWLRGRHLGVRLTPRVVEDVAREHLECVIKSEPPSGR